MEMLNLLSILVLFYSLSVVAAFQLSIGQLINRLVLEICFGCLFLNSFVNLNTGFYNGGKLCSDRQAMFALFKKTHLTADLSSFIAIFMLLSLDSADSSR